MKTNVPTSLLIALVLMFFAPLGAAQTPATDAATATTSQTISFAVGEGPEAVAFDGANIWVANQFSNTVSKVRISDGAILGTYSVGKRPVALVFDGANIWVANYLSDSVTKLRASDGLALGTYAAGDGPGGLAFDKTNIWVANRNSNDLTKLRASNGLKR